MCTILCVCVSLIHYTSVLSHQLWPSTQASERTVDYSRPLPTSCAQKSANNNNSNKSICQRAQVEAIGANPLATRRETRNKLKAKEAQTKPVVRLQLRTQSSTRFSLFAFCSLLLHFCSSLRHQVSWLKLTLITSKQSKRVAPKTAHCRQLC